MSKSIEQLVENIKEINGKNLVSVVRFAENSILILLNEIDTDILISNSAVSGRLQKSGYIPLYLTRDYIETSSDVYPLEYIRMKKADSIYHGSNLLDSIEISQENIRLESEQKIKGSLIRLTQIILEAGKNMRKLSRTCFLAIDDLSMGLGGMLYLAGAKISGKTSDLIDNAERHFKIDLGVFKTVDRWKNGSAPEDAKKTVYAFYEKIEELAALVDGMAV
ncbi:MAG: hypothetical protein JXJ19_10075 [Elusimicrobia bacterium]|nr:hypothetical protein [Elusimicrobiota bacterium]